MEQQHGCIRITTYSASMLQNTSFYIVDVVSWTENNIEFGVNNKCK